MKRKTFMKSMLGAFIVATMPFATPSFATDDTIKIGEINHYKRMAAFAGPYKQGIELALEEINNSGGVLGRRLEFVFRDDQGKPGEAIKIAEELMSSEGTAMITEEGFEPSINAV